MATTQEYNLSDKDIGEVKESNEVEITDFLNKVKRREAEMRAERSPFEAEWDYIDAQVNSKSFYDNDGRLIANCSVEQTLLEIHTGRTAQKLNYDVVSVGVEPDNVEEKIAKFTLADTLERDNFWKFYQIWEYNRGKYWTAVWVTTPKMERLLQYTYSNTKVSNDEAGSWYFSKKMVRSYIEKWKFAPREWSLRQLLIDDRAIWQGDQDKIRDIVLIETVTKEELELNFWNNELFDIEWLNELMTDDTEYWVTTTKWFIVLYYYFDKLTKEYGIVGNKSKVIYKSYMTTDELPISIWTYRFRSDCIYWYGLPRIVRTSKRYKDMIQQGMMDGAILASRVALIMNNTEFVDGEPQMSSLVNTWRTTWTGSPPQQMNLSNNLWYLTQVLNVIEDDIRADTGMDIRQAFEAPAQQLWTVEIMEENKAIRYKAVDWSRDLSIDRAFTQCLNNLAKFLPVVMREVGEVDWVKVTKSRPKIKVPNHKIVKKDDGKIYFEESYGDYWSFELKPKTITWDLTVSIVTPSTFNNNSVALSKNKNKEMVNTIAALSNIYWPQQVQEQVPFKDIWRMTKMDYWYWDVLNPDTSLDLKKRDQLAQIEQLKQISGLSLTQPQDGQNTQWWEIQTPMWSEQWANGDQWQVQWPQTTIWAPSLIWTGA